MHQPINVEATRTTSTANGKLVLLHIEGTSGAVTVEPASFFGWLTTVLLSGAQTAGRFTLVEGRGSRGASLPLHVHHHEDEVLYVMEGELTVSISGNEIPASAGAVVSLPRGLEHSCVVESEEAALLVLFSPAGIEDMISELAESDGRDGQDLEQLITVAARYDLDITGPPPRGRR